MLNYDKEKAMKPKITKTYGGWLCSSIVGKYGITIAGYHQDIIKAYWNWVEHRANYESNILYSELEYLANTRNFTKIVLPAAQYNELCEDSRKRQLEILEESGNERKMFNLSDFKNLKINWHDKV